MRVAINGLGRIGRLILKIGIEKNLNIVAVNDLSEIENIRYLLQHDSVYGKYSKNISVGKNFIKIGDKKINFLSESDPEKLPWKEMKVDVVIESTGMFTKKEEALKHINAGAKRVLVSAPMQDSDITVVPGINDKEIKPSHKIISMGSCTTNALAPIAKVLNEAFGIKKSFMTTIHSYTASQKVTDSSSKKMRRGRAAALNIIPTTTGATVAVSKAVPELKDKMEGLALRVPVACGSLIDYVVELKKNVTKDQINNLLEKSSKGKLKGILEYSEEELVSSDIIGNPHSSIVDGLSTQSQGNLVKILSWYDNEYGYSTRMVELAKKIS